MIAREKAEESLGSYSFKEAALYIRATLRRKPVFPRLNTQHLHWWVREGLVDDQSREPESGSEFINFLELISFRMIAMLRTYGISSKAIQLAHYRLQERWGWDYPFAMEPMWVASPDIFVEINKVPVTPTRDWQAALDMIREFWEPVEVGFHGLTFDHHQRAVSWVPSSGVILNPKVQFGEPCIQDTRVPTETIWAFYQAGDTIDTLAFMYGMPASKLQDAINWEEKVAKAAADERESDLSAG